MLIALVGTRNKRYKERDLNKSVLLLCGWVEDSIPNMYGNRYKKASRCAKIENKSVFLKLRISQSMQYEIKQNYGHVICMYIILKAPIFR